MFGLFIIFIIFILIAIYFYTYYYLKQIYIALRLNIKYYYIILAIISILIALLSLNIFSFSAIIILHWFIFGVFINLILLIINKVRKTNINYLKIKLIMPCVLTLLIMIYGYFNMTNVINTTYNLKTSKDLEQDYQVLFISDLHFGTTMDIHKLENITKKINKENYDFAILGGDIVDENTSHEEMINCFKLLGNIKTKYGIYYTYGNHDTEPYTNDKNYTEKELIDNIKNNNIIILEDDIVTINDDIMLLGRKEISMDSLRLDTKEAINKMDKDKYLIVVDHQPLDISYNEKVGFNLQLSGHTHAGQVFPAGTFIKLFLNEVAFGHENRENYDIIVSAGMGGWAYKFRTSAHSEYITVNISG